MRTGVNLAVMNRVHYISNLNTASRCLFGSRDEMDFMCNCISFITPAINRTVKTSGSNEIQCSLFNLKLCSRLKTPWKDQQNRLRLFPLLSRDIFSPAPAPDCIKAGLGIRTLQRTR